MGKSAVKGLFYICLIAATFILGAITIVAAFSGNMAIPSSCHYWGWQCPYS